VRQKNYTLVDQMAEPNTADIVWIAMIEHWASVTSTFVNFRVPVYADIKDVIKNTLIENLIAYLKHKFASAQNKTWS
jgi:hypothetical protein